jgi:hypothetical protein
MLLMERFRLPTGTGAHYMIDDGVRVDVTKAIAAFDRDIGKAMRFVLEADAARAVAAHGLEKSSNMLRMLEFARCPYPFVWIELANEWRLPVYEAGGVKISRYQPHRVGILIESVSEDGSRYIARTAWSQHDQAVPPSFSFCEALIDVGTPFVKEIPDLETLRADMIKLGGGGSAALKSDQELIASVQLDNHTKMGISNYTGFIKPSDDEAFMRYFESNIDNWTIDVASEIKYVFGFLLMLNARNAFERAREDMGKLNKSRLKSGKLALRDYEQVRMRLSRGERAELAAASGLGGGRRLHVCRGHFKARLQADGARKLFWWRPHMRGVGGELATRTKFVSA